MTDEPGQEDKEASEDKVGVNGWVPLAISCGISLVVAFLVLLIFALSWYLDPNSSLFITERKDLLLGIGSVGQVLAIGLTGTAAIISLIFTWRSQRDTKDDLIETQKNTR
jgi:hypothetical protein